jgi:hypothetical protein
VFDQHLEDVLRPGLSAAQQRSDTAYNTSFDAYNDIINNPRAGGFYDEFARTGGWDPARIASMDENIAGFKNIGRWGAGSPEDAFRLRGGGVYDEFSKTGGLSEGDRANIRDRSTSQIPAFYDSLKNTLMTQNNAQGGINPGFTSQMSKLARERGQESVNAAKDAELGIMQQVNEGRKWGTEGMTRSEQAIVQNMLAGLGGASDTEMGMMNSINQGRMFGTEGLAGLDRDKLAAASGIAGLRGQTPGEVNMYLDNILGTLGMRGQQVQGLLGQRMAYNPNRSFMDYAAPFLGAGGAILGGLVGGPPGAAIGGQVGGSLAGGSGRGATGNTGYAGGNQRPRYSPGDSIYT